jgi:hypothetical protein
MDLNAARVVLAHEAGYLTTPNAARRLNLSNRQFLALRRELIQQALGVPQLPKLAVPESAPKAEREPGQEG